LIQVLKYLAPYALVQLGQWAFRFRAIGCSSTRSLHLAFRSASREALVASRVELLPRRSLGGIRTVVDVGANTGQWLEAFLQFVPVETVHAFEPNPHCLAILRSKAAACRGSTDIKLHGCAVGDRTGSARLHVTRASALASLLAPSPELAKEYPGSAELVSEIDVKVVRLDDALSDVPEIDLLKLDVQGFERWVIAGAPETLARTKMVLIEMNFIRHYSGELGMAGLASLLSETIGFEYHNASLPHRTAEGRAAWFDAVFVRPGLDA
jgi:FkbM family methyltransferase